MISGIMRVIKSPAQRISKKNMAMRRQLWSEITDNMPWHRKRKTGFTTVPRTMSYIFEHQAKKGLKGKPLSP